MDRVVLDFETRSMVSIAITDKTKYLRTKASDIVCLGYRINGEGEPQLWRPGQELPDFVKNPTNYILYAFNAQFDKEVWEVLGEKYGFPKTEFSNWVDVMALCGRYTFHQSLDMAGKDLEIEFKKETKRGHDLMKLICVPPFKYTRQDLLEFFEYCKQDIRATEEILNKLPTLVLSTREQKIWEYTCEMNKHGLPIDMPAVKQIYKVAEAYKEDQNQLLPTLTGGLITKATQTKRITDWIRNKGVVLPNLQAATVEQMLKRRDLPEDVITVLELRQELGLSSTAKYKALINKVYQGRIYDNNRYYGTNTGRSSGMGFQLKNLPRSDVKDAQPIIDKFFDLSIIDENPVKAAKSIIRGMICAPKGKRISAIDYSSIEYVGLIWITDNDEALVRFRDGFDQYVDMAVFLYNKDYDSIVDTERYFGKQLILGCGYGLGWRGFIGYCEGRNLDITDAQAQHAVNAYRTKYAGIVRFWYACRTAAVNAINFPGKTYKTHKCKFTVVKDNIGTKWLKLLLPSGRPLYYNKPMLKDDTYGVVPTAMGINPYSKQWSRLKIIPGRFAENIIQAMCRDLLFHSLFELKKEGYKVLGDVYDEAIMEVDKNASLDHITEVFCRRPAWAHDLPIRAEGMIERRYRKM